MGSPEKYVHFPLYVVHIGLLYALLLTSGLLLAWVTIYRHEQSIAELRQMVKTQEEKHQSLAVNATDKQKAEQRLLSQENVEVEDKVADENRPRVRRRKEKNAKREGVKKCKVKCLGEKGERGDKGRRGRHGKAGSQGPQGPPGSPGPPGFAGHAGQRGERGFEGRKGEMGEKGDRGEDGKMGITGGKGEKGDAGIPGIDGVKGSKGDQGKPGDALMRSESAHVVGNGNTISSAPPPGDVYKITSWHKDHGSGKIRYDNGHIVISIDGVYFVYSQLYYFDRNNSYTGFNVYIDNKRILKAIYSVVDFHKPYHTQFIGGVFKINKGQRIWVGTTIKRKYFFNESSSFFGAFLLHP